MGTMTVRYVYKGSIIGAGTLSQIPRTGDFIELQAANTILIVEAVMFQVLLDASVVAMIYVKDVMSETEKKLRNY